MDFKEINLNGITYLEKLDGTDRWYWGSDYLQGDLYEAEENFEAGYPVKCNRLVFVKYPEGEIVEPILPRDDLYFGRPVFYDDCIAFILADFPAGKILVEKYNPETDKTEILTSLERRGVDDCYNLILRTYPLILTRSGNDGRFQILWPEKSEFRLEATETVFERRGDKLLSSVWYEDPDYWEELIVRKYPTGEMLERYNGALLTMPDGQKWLVK